MIKRTLGLAAAVALMAACGNNGNEYFQPAAGPGKAESQFRRFSKVVWSDGERTKGAYVRAMVGDIFDSTTGGPAEDGTWQDPERLIDIVAHVDPDQQIDGHLGFWVPAEDALVTLGKDSFELVVSATVKQGSPSDFVVALLKFCEAGEEACPDQGYHAVTAPLDEAMDGATVTPMHDRPDVPGMFDQLQSSVAESADRRAFAGTWKVIVAPRDWSKRYDRVLGTDAVSVSEVDIFAAEGQQLSPEPSSCQVPIPVVCEGDSDCDVFYTTACPAGVACEEGRCVSQQK